MMNTRITYNQSGYSVLEVLLAGAIFALAASGIIAGILFARQSSETAQTRDEAQAMAREGVTALKSIRTRDWSSVSTGNGQALSFDTSTSQWSLIENPSSSEDTKGRLTRRVDITSGDLPDTKDVTVRVEYPINRTDTDEVTLNSLLAKLDSNRYGGTGPSSENYRIVDEELGGYNQECDTDDDECR
jgi:Tfp pilus assembly protein PilV